MSKEQLGVLSEPTGDQVHSSSPLVSIEQPVVDSTSADLLPISEESSVVYEALAPAVLHTDTAGDTIDSVQQFGEEVTELSVEAPAGCGDNITKLIEPAVMLQHPHYEQIVESEVSEWTDELSVALHTNVATEYVEVITEGEDYVGISGSVPGPGDMDSAEITPHRSIEFATDGNQHLDAVDQIPTENSQATENGPLSLPIDVASEIPTEKNKAAEDGPLLLSVDAASAAAEAASTGNEKGPFSDHETISNHDIQHSNEEAPSSYVMESLVPSTVQKTVNDMPTNDNNLSLMQSVEEEISSAQTHCDQIVKTRAGRKRKLPGKFSDSIVNLFGETKDTVDDGYDAVDLLRDDEDREQRVVLKEPLRQSRIKRVQLESVKKPSDDVDVVSSPILVNQEPKMEVETSNKVDETSQEVEPEIEITDFRKKKRNYKREQNVACPLCGILLKDYDSVFDHVRLQHAGHAQYESSLAQVKALMRVLCTVCNRYYCSKDQLLAHHKLMHTEHQTARCEDCGIVVKSEKHLVAHRKHRHTASDVTYLCDRCPASFAYRSYLNTHIQQVHPPPGQPAFPCDQCDKCYSSSKYLYCHRLRVHGAKRFSCKYCMKSFTTNTNMLRHVSLIHEKHKPKPFSCAVCPKAFSLKANLQEHVQTVHYRFYNFHCDICKAGFRRKKQLESHKENVHSNMSNTVIKCVPVTDKQILQQFSNPLPSSGDSRLPQSSFVNPLTANSLSSNVTIVENPSEAPGDTVAYIVASQDMLESFGIAVSKPNDLIIPDSTGNSWTYSAAMILLIFPQILTIGTP